MTIAALFTQKIKAQRRRRYIVAQLAGGVAGALLLRAALGSRIVDALDVRSP